MYCEVDEVNAYQELQPDITRKGLAMRFTANIGDSAQVYAMANYCITKTSAAFTPLGFNGTPPPPGPSRLRVQRDAAGVRLLDGRRHADGWARAATPTTAR